MKSLVLHISKNASATQIFYILTWSFRPHLLKSFIHSINMNLQVSLPLTFYRNALTYINKKNF